MKSCRPRSGLLTWHPSASTADSLLARDWELERAGEIMKEEGRRRDGEIWKDGRLKRMGWKEGLRDWEGAWEVLNREC
jgi:hypothetical protein